MTIDICMRRSKRNSRTSMDQTPRRFGANVMAVKNWPAFETSQFLIFEIPKIEYGPPVSDQKWRIELEIPKINSK